MLVITENTFFSLSERLLSTTDNVLFVTMHRSKDFEVIDADYDIFCSY